MIGALLNQKLIAPFLCDFNIDSNVFYIYVKEVLLKNIPKNSIIVMDNASFHKRQDIQNIIQEHNHQLIYLPPYSPHLNPIEKKWAHLKALRRKYNLSIENVLTQITQC